MGKWCKTAIPLAPIPTCLKIYSTRQVAIFIASVIAILLLLCSPFSVGNRGTELRRHPTDTERPYTFKKELWISGREQACLTQATVKMGTMKSLNKIRAALHVTRLSTYMNGDFIEAGVAEGGGTFPILYYLACTGLLRGRKIHLFDTWEGIPAPVNEEDYGFQKGQYLVSLEGFWKNAERWKEYYENQTSIQTDAVSWKQAIEHLNLNVGLFHETMP